MAVALLKAMPGARLVPDAVTFNSVLSSYSKAGLWQQALLLLKLMPEARVQLDVISFSAAISACEKSGEWEQAMNLFHALSAAAIQPDVILCSALISTCGLDWLYLKCFPARPAEGPVAAIVGAGGEHELLVLQEKL